MEVPGLDDPRVGQIGACRPDPDPAGGLVRRLASAGEVPQALAESNTAQTWGKQIYFEGTSPTGGEITAIVGSESVSLPGATHWGQTPWCTTRCKH